MLASKVIERYQLFCPPELAMNGDVSGLQIGSLHKDIRRVMVALDIRETTVEEAIDKEIDLIIVKHAPLFRPIKSFLTDDPQAQIYLKLLQHNIAVYVSHTDIDVLQGGLNDWFCDLLDIDHREILHETSPGQGIGRIGTIQEQTLEEFAQKVKARLRLDSIRLVSYAHQSQHYIQKVAICGGSGDDFYKEALSKGADVYVTGDIYYHTGQEMLTQGLLGLDPGHHIEVLFVQKITEKLEEWKVEKNWDVEIFPSTVSTNPFRHL